MYPERPTVSPALCCRRPADSAPVGRLNTGLLRSLFHIASHPPSLCLLLLPRVHAAEVATAQLAQMPTPTPTPTPAPAPMSVPSIVGKPEFPDTGWDRIKDLFNRDATERYPEELDNVIKSGLAAALAGFIYGGMPAGRHARERFIQISQAQIFTSRVDAMRSAHNAAIRGFIRYGFRWSWRVAAFVTLFNAVSTGLSVYRDKNSFGYYAAAGAVTGGLFRLNLGLKGLVAGTIIGATMGLPTGAVIIGMQSLSGETVRERRRRERRELYEHRLAEWTARLQLTDDLMSDLGSGAERTGQDLQRIQELLSLPQNEGVAPDSDSQ